jgi:hypothetical protein
LHSNTHKPNGLHANQFENTCQIRSVPWSVCLGVAALKREGQNKFGNYQQTVPSTGGFDRAVRN